MTAGVERIAGAAGIALISLLLSLLAGGAQRSHAAGDETVTISGVVYAFFGIDDHAPGSVIRVDEFPGLSAPVALDGSYSIEVPDDVNVTLYADPPETYERTYLQTFRTSGQDIEKAHFQLPRTSHYNAFSNLLKIPRDDDGVIEDCAIVSTFSIHEARDAVDFDPGFKDVYPHGLPGSTATISPAVTGIKGATYFAFEPLILPDPTRTESSVDGGVLWTEVPPGYYWLEPDHPTERMAPFLAHCENGRVINASPPWGFYELKPGEEPDPAVMAKAPDEAVDATVARRAVVRKSAGRRTVTVSLIAREPLEASMTVKRGSRSLAPVVRRSLKDGKRGILSIVRRTASRGPATVTVDLKDAVGNTARVTRRVVIPR
jgi:hypothetical protein